MVSSCAGSPDRQGARAARWFERHFYATCVSGWWAWRNNPGRRTYLYLSRRLYTDAERREMLQYTNFKLALLAAADTEPGTVYSHPFEEGLYVVPETRAEEQRLVDAGVVLAEVEPV